MSQVAASAIDERLLIPKVRRMIAAIGLDLTLKLLETLGGTNLELPYGRHMAHRGKLLEGIIGKTAARAFHQEFANGERRILLPKADKILMQVRDQAICTAEASGTSMKNLALQYRLTIRQIQNIVHTGVRALPARPTNQYDLFSPPNSANGTRADA